MAIHLHIIKNKRIGVFTNKEEDYYRIVEIDDQTLEETIDFGDFGEEGSARIVAEKIYKRNKKRYGDSGIYLDYLTPR